MPRISLLGLLGCKSSCGQGLYDENDEFAIPKQSFIRLCKQRRFTAINDILKSPNLNIGAWLDEAVKSYAKAFENFGGGGDKGSDKAAKKIRAYNGENALHILVYFRPPLTTVDLLASWIRDNKIGIVPEDAINAKGETPLHIAVRRACAIGVIERLANVPMSSLPATTLDCARRTPLHWACCMEPPVSYSGEGSLGLRIYHSNAPSKEFSELQVSMVLCLIKAFPQASVIEDANGQTPLDLAVEKKLEKRILLSLLQAAGDNSSGASTADDEMSLNSIPREVMGHYSGDSSLLSEAVSSIGTSGCSVYKPQNAEYEGRDFYEM